MRIGVPKESATNERRVALVPDSVARLVKAGLEVVVERGAGAAANVPDEAYATAGATLVDRAAALGADVVVKVQRPSDAEIAALRADATLIALMQPAASRDLIRQLAERRVTVFAMELVPRITRAQSMDALSSQATVAGYKAVLIAAAELGRLLPMLTTAAGTLAPARALILGAGVAGLQAIATARRLGAVVSAFDVRPAAREQVQSLGAKFVETDAVSTAAEGAGGYAKELAADQQQQVLNTLARHVPEADIVITTAQIPGKPAPRLITAAMVRAMRPGSVIVDLAAETGGNCELTKLGETVHENGVTIMGPPALAATVPAHASQMYSRNIQTLLDHVVKNGTLAIDLGDEITKAMVVTHAGEVRA